MAMVRQALLFSVIATSNSLVLGEAGHKESASFLQIGQNTLPKVSTLLTEPHQVLETLNSQISSLEAGLAEKEKQSKQAIEQLKAGYESQLNAQENNNKMLHRMNKALVNRSVKLRDSNVALREEAKGLETECLNLEADLNVLKINISTAQEFAALAFEASGPMLDNATELAVLAELENKEAADRDSQLHQQRLNEVTGLPPSLLQVSAAGKQGPKNPQDLLEALMASLNDLSQEQNESEASLKTSFEEEFQAGIEKQQALIKRQAEINATIAESEALHEKLLAAVSHLKETRNGLLEKSRSLRGYAKKVADARIQSLSLLQITASRHAAKGNVSKALPRVSTVLSKPTEVYQSMNSNVDQLEQRLSEVERQQTAKVAEQKAEYEQRLQEQFDENTRIKTANLKLLTEIEALQRTSAGLRVDAKKQSATNENLRNELQILQKNVTTAQEFMSMALAKAADLSNASQLSVLSELDAADATRAHEAERRYLLSTVSKPRELGLLELTAARGVTPDPQAMLQQLLASLGDLAREQNASAEALKATFEKQFREGSARRTGLLKEQAELNEKKTSEKELLERLQVAVDFLKKTGSDLEKHNESLRSFLGRFGLRPKAKTQEAKAEVELPVESKHATTQETPKSEPLSLASAGRGKVLEAVSSVAQTKKQKRLERRERQKEMTQAKSTVNVRSFLAENGVVTHVKGRHDVTQIKPNKVTEGADSLEHTKKATQTKHVKHVKVTNEEPSKTGITQSKHSKGKEQGNDIRHEKKATSAKPVKQAKAKKEAPAKKDITESKHKKAKEQGTDVEHANRATPSKPVEQVQQDEPAEIEDKPPAANQEEPSKIEEETQNTADMMAKKPEAGPAGWLSPVTQKLSWLMR